MREKRFRIGLFVTLAWLMSCVGILIWKYGELAAMAPNAWGDLFAGCFAPLAFLWLVIGYLQQGEELKLSREALLLQAEELRNSVEQQRALVEVTRLQLEGEREALAYERGLREEAARPHFVVVPAGGSFQGNGSSTYNLSITNTGNTATLVTVELTMLGIATANLGHVPVFDRGHQQRASFQLSAPLPGENNVLRISYKDTTGKLGEELFAVTRETPDPQSSLKVLRIGA